MTNPEPCVFETIVFSFLKSVFFLMGICGVASVFTTGLNGIITAAVSFVWVGAFGFVLAVPCIIAAWICIKILLSRKITHVSIWIICSILISAIYALLLQGTIFGKTSVELIVILFVTVGGLSSYLNWKTLVYDPLRELVRKPDEVAVTDDNVSKVNEQ